MKRLCVLILIAGSQLIALAATARSAEKDAAAVSTKSASKATAPLSDQQKAWLAQGQRHDKHGWVYLHIEGEPRARGFQHGYLLAREIADALRITRRVWEYDTAMDWSWLVANAKSMFVPKTDAENLAEIDGIVEGMAAAGASTTRDEIVAFNGIGELEYYWFPKVKDKVDDKAPIAAPQACSAFIATGRMTADGKIVMAHNTMFGYAEPYWPMVILDVQPTHGHRILMQAAPGSIQSGTDFFITDAGLVGTETTIAFFKGFDEKGIPEFVRMRRAMQDADSIDQWCEIMKKGNNGGYANSWLLGDINTGEIARLELGLKHVSFEKKTDGYFAGSNLVEDPKILRFETGVNEVDIRLTSVARQVRWQQLMKQYAGKIDVDVSKGLLADHYDTFLQQDHPDCRSLCSHGNLDAQPSGAHVPYAAWGTLDGKVVDAKMAREMSFAARWGSSCGMAFDAGKYLEAHPQFSWMRDVLKSRPSQPWTVFQAGEKSANN